MRFRVAEDGNVIDVNHAEKSLDPVDPQRAPQRRRKMTASGGPRLEPLIARIAAARTGFHCGPQ